MAARKSVYQGDYFSIDIDSNGTEFVRTGDEVLIVPLTEGGDIIVTIEPALRG